MSVNELSNRLSIAIQKRLDAKAKLFDIEDDEKRVQTLDDINKEFEEEFRKIQLDWILC